MTIAYIKSNAKRRALLVLIIAGIWLVMPFCFVRDVFKGGWRYACREFMREATQGGSGFWVSVAECWCGAKKGGRQ